MLWLHPHRLSIFPSHDRVREGYLHDSFIPDLLPPLPECAYKFVRPPHFQLSTHLLIQEFVVGGNMCIKRIIDRLQSLDLLKEGSGDGGGEERYGCMDGR
jgi:hypothetical protein